MSAWIVAREHIDVLLSAALPDFTWYSGPNFEHRHHLDHTNTDEVGRMLWAENVASVAHRYPDDTDETRPGHPFDVDRYTYRPYGAYVPTPVEALKAIGCYEYQSCEHPGWRTSVACAYVRALEQHLIDQLPGYDQAPWDFDAAAIAKLRARRREEQHRPRPAALGAALRGAYAGLLARMLDDHEVRVGRIVADPPWPEWAALTRAVEAIDEAFEEPRQ